MAESKLPCPTLMRLLLRYEPGTGDLFWRKRPRWLFPSQNACAVWNSRRAGKKAFATQNVWGYRRSKLLKHSASGHRVAWAIFHGEWPECQIDHINRDPGDNRIANLRVATPAENRRNSVGRGKASTFCGVTKDRGKWKSRCTDSLGKLRSLGRFGCEEDAARAYDAFASREHGEFARLNFPAR
jgi:hypothetical protein